MLSHEYVLTLTPNGYDVRFRGELIAQEATLRGAVRAAETYDEGRADR